VKTETSCEKFYLLLLVAAEFEVFAALDGKLFAELTLGAFHLQHNLLGRLGLHSQTEMA